MEINRYQTRKPKRLAVVTMGVKLGDETRGYTRFRFLSELLAREASKSTSSRHRSSIGTRRIATRRKHATETFPTT